MQSAFKKAPILTLVFVVVLSLFLNFNVSALSPEIYSVEITSNLLDDGSMEVTEVWDVQVVDGTEWYLVHDNLRNIEITDFTVRDENNTLFQFVGDWDIDLSLEEKAYTNGFNQTDNGVELCWGVGSYGKHTFTVSYKMSNVVVAYSDYDGLYHRFLNPGLSSDPQKVSVTLLKNGVKLDESNTRIWAFGYEGQIGYTNGKIRAYSTQSLDTDDNHVTLLIRFNKNIIVPTYSESENQFTKIQEMAQDGSYYGDGAEIIAIIIVLILLVLIIPLIIFFSIKYYKSTNIYYYRKNYGFKSATDKNYLKDIGYHRDIPFEGDIPSIVWTLKDLAVPVSDGNLMGAYLLKWQKQKFIRIFSDEKTMFTKRDKVSIEFNSDLFESEHKQEEKLFNLLLSASGSDHILQEDELQKWAQNNFEKIQNCIKSFSDAGKSVLLKNNVLEKRNSKGIFGSAYRFNPNGFTKALETLKFKNYLKDFTIINERKAVEVQLWDDYLIVASLYGIAKQVAKEFQNVYPDFFLADSTTYNDPLFTFYAISRISQTYTTTAASAGGGGAASIGGGTGGFSGGGFGGGSR